MRIEHSARRRGWQPELRFMIDGWKGALLRFPNLRRSGLRIWPLLIGRRVGIALIRFEKLPGQPGEEGQGE
jgi:hypothetical protein